MTNKLSIKLKAWIRSAKIAFGFEAIHYPFDLLIIYLFMGDLLLSLGAVTLQHILIFIMHTIYDKVVYRKALEDDSLFKGK